MATCFKYLADQAGDGATDNRRAGEPSILRDEFAMSTRRRASGSSTTVEDGLTLPRYSHSESEDEEGDARPPDGELRDPEQFESLEGHGHAAANGDSWDKSRRVKSGREKLFRIYVMHLLFMWNSRTYEFASVSQAHTLPKHVAHENRLSSCHWHFLVVLLRHQYGRFLLLYGSDHVLTVLRGIASTVPAVFFASVIGNWIDCSKSRVPPLLTSVYLSHGAVTLSYIAWLLWPVLLTGYGEETPDAQAWNLSKALLFGFIISMDIIHDLSAIANRVSLERDWLPVLVGPITPEVTYGLTQVNAVMKRLDLISKLVAPSILPLIISIFNFREGWILLLAVTAVIFLAIQLRYVHLIARGNPELQALKKPSTGIATDEDCTVEDQYDHLSSGIRSWRHKTYLALYKDPLARLTHYFSMPVWPASIAEAFSQMTVLAYSSTLITYLFEVGFSLTVVTIARGSGTVMALASTFIGPIAVNFVRRRKIRQSPSRNAAGDDIEGAVVRTVGIWGILSQVLCMVSMPHFNCGN